MLEGKVKQVSADASENQNAAPASVAIARNKSAMSLTHKIIVDMNGQALIAQGVSGKADASCAVDSNKNRANIRNPC